MGINPNVVDLRGFVQPYLCPITTFVIPRLDRGNQFFMKGECSSAKSTALGINPDPSICAKTRETEGRNQESGVRSQIRLNGRLDNHLLGTMHRAPT